MSSDQAILYDLILLYRSQLESAIFYLNEKSKLSKGFHTISRTGYLDTEHKVPYYFHGIGCTITVGDISLSVDFGEEGRCDGFTPHILASFLYHNRSVSDRFVSINNFAKIQALLNELEADGLIRLREYLCLGPMYVMPTDFFAEQPLAWVH